MNTNHFLTRLLRSALVPAAVVLLGVTAGQAADDYENHVTFSAGSGSVNDHTAGYQHKLQQTSESYGGIDDLFYTKSLNDTTTLTLKGRALLGDHDYRVDLDITKDDVGYLKLGYKEYRVWFDGIGGYFPPNGFNMKLYDEELHLDRANLWFEAGYVPADKVNFIFRYDLFTRRGQKDSTSWGDTSLTGGAGTRALLPSFYDVDETRHQVTGTLFRDSGDYKWDLGLRYDKGDFVNSRNMARTAGQSTQRFVTEKDGRDYDLFMVHGSYITKIHEKLMVTTAVSTEKIDSTLSGDRIYGPDYDPVFDVASAGRQYRDEGFIDLTGDTTLKQTVGTINILYQPTENWYIVPALRMEKIDTNDHAEFEETAVQSNLSTAVDTIGSESDRSWKNVSESIEARYKGIKNMALNFKGEFLQATGDLTEKETDEPGTPAAAVTIDRDTNFKRGSQKLSASMNWYPTTATSFTAQYYYKARQNDYNSPRDNTVSSADRYPAYIANQDFVTNDLNLRFSWRLTPELRSVTRYDYQQSEIHTQEVGLAYVKTNDVKTHIFSETLSFNPLPRWYLQGTMNYVWDVLTTPAVKLTGAAGNRVKNSDANYLNVTLGTGYVLSDSADLFVDYSDYSAFNDFVDNSAGSVAYGTDARTQQAGVTLNYRLDSRTSMVLRYAYAKNTDSTYGTAADYTANVVTAKVQYRF